MKRADGSCPSRIDTSERYTALGSRDLCQTQMDHPPGSHRDLASALLRWEATNSAEPAALRTRLRSVRRKPSSPWGSTVPSAMITVLDHCPAGQRQPGSQSSPPMLWPTRTHSSIPQHVDELNHRLGVIDEGVGEVARLVAVPMTEQVHQQYGPATRQRWLHCSGEQLSGRRTLPAVDLHLPADRRLQISEESKKHAFPDTQSTGARRAETTLFSHQKPRFKMYGKFSCQTCPNDDQSRAACADPPTLPRWCSSHPQSRPWSGV